MVPPVPVGLDVRMARSVLPSPLTSKDASSRREPDPTVPPIMKAGGLAPLLTKAKNPSCSSSTHRSSFLSALTSIGPQRT